ncbi:MAG TPA: PKD domain-containing protein [Candidatus Cloacimonadota bacterium]|nr:PKD domain-containing protein [Candidatus Cloacimonadota bacterium]
MKNTIILFILLMVSTAFATTIYDIQYTTDPGTSNYYPSPLVGQSVTVTGIVTGADYGQDNKFFMSDPEGGPWHGIYVYDYTVGPALGDEVEVTGTVSEYYGLTELGYCTITILSSGNTVPAPSVVTTLDLAVPALAEQYEGCLVSVSDVIVTEAQNNYGEWYVDDGSGECQVDDGFFYLDTVTPPIVITVGMTWAQIIGCLDFSYDEYAINPRTPDDLIDTIVSLDADFSATPLSGNVPLEVTFTDASSGNITSWAWDFDNDGNIDSNDQNPIYTYEAVGTYTVSLTVSNGTLTDTETKTDYITVNMSVSADFSADPLSGYAPLEVQFSDLSTGNITSWAWDFDNDGTIDSNEQNPTYTYTEPGTYSVALTVQDAYCSDTAVENDYITVDEAVIADFSATPLSGLAPLEVQFTDATIGNVGTWAWDFDNDGNIDSVEQNPLFTYDQAGDYTVTLTVTDVTGGYTSTETKEDYISVGESVVADFSATPLSGIAPLEVQFTDASTGSITSWAWDFENDGTIDSNEQNPTHTYTSGGTYTVSLLVSDGTSTDTKVRNNYISVTEVGNDVNLITFITLDQNYPNPFNPETTISFTTLNSSEYTQIDIYNLKGQKVRQLVSAQLTAGPHAVVWNGTDDQGNIVPSGVYIYRMKSGDFQQTRKMILMK